MFAIGYIRISTVDQSTYSLEYQEAAVRKYCTDNKLTILEVFKDNGESSYTFDRPDWKALESFIRKNKAVTHLIIYDHDRFSRNLPEALMKIKELQTKFNIKVLATSDPFNIDTSDMSVYITRVFKYMIAETELMRIRERTKAGIMHALIGGYFPNMAPYGYKNMRTEDGKPSLIPDPIKSQHVKEIFELRKQGKSPENIRSIIKEKGFNMKGNEAIQRILANPVYAGLIKVPAFKGKEAFYVPGKHKAIIPESEYWALQSTRGASMKQNRDEVPLRGVLKCWCGKPVTAGNSKGRTKYYWYYLCSEHRENMKADILHGQLGELLSRLSFSKDDIEWFRERFTYEIAILTQTNSESIENIGRELNALKSKIFKTEERYLSNPEISSETYQKVMTDLRSQKGILENKLASILSSSKDYIKMMETLLPKLADLSQAFESMTTDAKQQFVRVIFGDSLKWVSGSYRTEYLHPLIMMKASSLKDDRLLIIEQPVIKMSEKNRSTPDGNAIEPFESIYVALVG